MTGPRLKQHTATVGGRTYGFDGLVELMAKATPLRSGDELAGCAAASDAERAAAQWALADLPLGRVPRTSWWCRTRTTRSPASSSTPTTGVAFRRISHLTVGGLRDWLLDVAAAPTDGRGRDARRRRARG